MFYDIEEHIRISKCIDVAGERATDSIQESLRDRWEHGRMMLAERNGKKNLPNGRMPELVAATGCSQPELNFRIRFAERYSTEDELCRGLQSFTSWTQAKNSLPKITKTPDPNAEPTVYKRHDRHEEVVGLYEQGLSVGQIKEQTGMGRQVRHILEREKIERQVSADSAPLDWNTISGTAKTKLERAEKSIRRDLENNYRKLLDAERVKYRADCDAQVSAYKAAYKAEVDGKAARFNVMRDEERKRYQLGIEAQRANGVIELRDYNTILSCLHPDSRRSASDDKLAQAFRLFNNPLLKVLLVKEP